MTKTLAIKPLILISAALYGALKPWTLAGFIAGCVTAALIEVYVHWRIKDARKYEPTKP